MAAEASAVARQTEDTNDDTGGGGDAATTNVHLKIDGLLCQYFELYGEYLAYMNQIGRDLVRGHSKFLAARVRDPTLMLGTASYAGRNMNPLVTLDEGETLRVCERKLGVPAPESGEGKEKTPSSLALMRKRALAKAAEHDPRIKKILEEKQKEDAVSKVKGDIKEIASEINASVEDKMPLEDPVAWFGCLIPPEVRQARERFLTALKKLVRVADICREMRKIEADIRSLKNTLPLLGSTSKS